MEMELWWMNQWINWPGYGLSPKKGHIIYDIVRKHDQSKCNAGSESGSPLILCPAARNKGGIIHDLWCTIAGLYWYRCQHWKADSQQVLSHKKIVKLACAEDKQTHVRKTHRTIQSSICTNGSNQKNGHTRTEIATRQIRPQQIQRFCFSLSSFHESSHIRISQHCTEPSNMALWKGYWWTMMKPWWTHLFRLLRCNMVQLWPHETNSTSFVCLAN